MSSTFDSLRDRPVLEPTAAPTREAPDDGQPLFIVLNSASGHGSASAAEQAVRDVLHGSGRHYELLVVTEPKALPDVAARAAALGIEHRGSVVAAGGDGTINAVLQATYRSGRPFGVIPQGTFNYAARTHGIPQDPAEATRALLDAEILPIQIGLVNERVFLVNASLGLYPDLLERREGDTRRFGRHRVVAWWSALTTLLREHRQLVIDIERENQAFGVASRVRTTTLFAGNNALQLESIGIAEADALGRGELVASVLRPLGPLGMLGIAIRGALGKLGDSANVHSFGFTQMTVRPWLPYGRRTIKVATDGEVTVLTTPLTFRVASVRVPLLVPRREHRVP